MPSDASPTARALLALEFIQARPGATATQLADRLGVSDRAARRYVEILREAGIPVDATRGPYGGYRIGRGARIPPLMFSESEALGLVMAVLDGHHAAGDVEDPAGSALGKIVRVLPGPVAGQVEAIRRTAAAAPDRAAARPDPIVVVSLIRACAQRRVVTFDYRSEAGSQWRVRLAPWAVVVRHGRWYLLGPLRSGPDAGDVPERSDETGSDERFRALRLDRMSDVAVEDEIVNVPADLDAVGLLERHLSTGWEFQTEVQIDAPVSRVRRLLPGVLGRLEPIDDDHCRLVGTTSNTEWYAQQLAPLRCGYRIVGGSELRASAVAMGARLQGAAG